MTKEYLEVFSSGISATINDFKELKIFANGKTRKIKFFNQNKGQKEMVKAFIKALLTDGKAPIPFEEIVSVSKASFKIIESVNRGGEQVVI